MPTRQHNSDIPDTRTIAEIYTALGPQQLHQKVTLPLASSSVAAGFPSPADDFVENHLDLNDYLIKHPSATFFVRASGNSMIRAGIRSGDLLIVDRSVEPYHNAIIIAVLEGEFTVKRLEKRGSQIVLQPENPSYQPIFITDDSEFSVWGVVTHVIHSAGE